MNFEDFANRRNASLRFLRAHSGFCLRHCIRQVEYEVVVTEISFEVDPDVEIFSPEALPFLIDDVDVAGSECMVFAGTDPIESSPVNSVYGGLLHLFQCVEDFF